MIITYSARHEDVCYHWMTGKELSFTVSDSPDPLDPPDNQQPPPDYGAMLSPIRPPVPESDLFNTPSRPKMIPPGTKPLPEAQPQNPHEALDYIRGKMEKTSDEFASGKLNQAQFSAIYKHYADKRAIIEKLLQRDPQSSAWQNVASTGHTGFLRSHFEARALFFAIFIHKKPSPLLTGGRQTNKIVGQISAVLRMFWSSAKLPNSGIARKALDNGRWLVLATGKFGITFVVFSLQPSDLQLNLVRDLHTDFERANHMFLERGTLNPQRMVFPQRGLVPQLPSGE